MEDVQLIIDASLSAIKIVAIAWVATEIVKIWQK